MEGREANYVISMPGLSYIPHPGGLGCTLYEKMWENHEKVAQVCGLTGKKQTYHDLLVGTVRTALKMRSKGITSEDTVLICSEDCLELYVPFMAAIFLGAKSSILDPNLSPTALASLIDQIRPALIFVSPEKRSAIENVSSPQTRVEILGGAGSAEFTEPHPNEDEFRPVPLGDLMKTVLICFTRGSTTDSPKAVCLNHYTCISTAHNLGTFLSVNRVLVLDFCYGIASIQLLMAAILYGGSRIAVPRFDPQTIWSILINIKPTLALMSPNIAREIARIEQPQLTERLFLQLVILTGDFVASKVFWSMAKMFPTTKITVGYIQTEAGGLVSVYKPNRPEEMGLLERNPSASGKLTPGYSLKVVDIDSERILGPNEVGELRISSDHLMKGYHKRDQDHVWDCEGWYRTGDVGYYNTDECVFVKGRIGEMVKSQGSLVFPGDLEEVLELHPAIAEAVIFRFPNEENFMGLVVLFEGVGSITEEDIKKFARRTLKDGFKLNLQIKCLDEIPTDASGSISRRILRHMLTRGEF